MKYRTFGRLGWQVSEISFGAWAIGGSWGHQDDAESLRALHRALDLGVNFIDTANIYEGYHRYLGSKGGVAEEILGQALAGRRQQVVVATKAGNPVGPNPEDTGLSPTHLRRECERSLDFIHHGSRSLKVFCGSSEKCPDRPESRHAAARFLERHGCGHRVGLREAP